jgi:predicted DNA-binding ribbon-helix-helix protein
MSGLVKRSVTLAGHRTSIALEAEFWAALAACAEALGMPLAALVAGIDAQRGGGQGLASALRVFVLQNYVRR